jgi:hypothetical protein
LELILKLEEFFVSDEEAKNTWRGLDVRSMILDCQNDEEVVWLEC